jgi:hypothetical protein
MLFPRCSPHSGRLVNDFVVVVKFYFGIQYSFLKTKQGRPNLPPKGTARQWPPQKKFGPKKQEERRRVTDFGFNLDTDYLTSDEATAERLYNLCF